jgi:hypothetical protein
MLYQPAMAKLSQLQIIKDKRREVELEIARRKDAIDVHVKALEPLEKTARDLEIAERVLASLSDAGNADSDRAAQTRESTAKTEDDDGKPAGIPTVPEMIIEALQVARSNGSKGLEPKEIVAYIAKRWWPNVPQNSIGPIAWRMAERDKEKRVLKRGTRYFLPKEDDEARMAS